MERIVVVGASGLAKIVIDIIERSGHYAIAGLIDAQRPPGATFFGYPVLGNDDDAPSVCETLAVDAAAIAIGDNWRRHLVAERLRRLVPGWHFPPVLDPSVHLARGASIGRGTIAMHGVAVSCDTRLGEFVLCAYNASVGEDCEVGDFATLAQATAIAGGVSFGAFSVLAVGAAVVHGVSIGHHTVVGAGATAVSDIGDHVVALGTPASVIRRRQAGDGYL